jgi:branched-chain amino acid transport system permease protein
MRTVVVGGFFAGLIYGVLALGLVVTYRVSRIINFGYGETGMLAAFVYLELRTGNRASGVILHDHGTVLPIIVALLIGAAIGAAMEMTVARPARKSSTLNGMVGTVAFGLLLLVIAGQRYGPTVHPVPALIPGEGIHVFGQQVTPAQLLTLGCVAVLVPAIAALYRFSSIGVRLRAIAIDSYAAGQCGINVNAMSTATWACAGALSALSAMLIASIQGYVSVLFMTVLALRAFAAALVGGLTSLWAGFLLGIGFGVFEQVVQYWSPVHGITDLCIAAAILLIMVARPVGLVRAQY